MLNKRDFMRVTLCTLFVPCILVILICTPCVADSKIASIVQGSYSLFILKDDGSVWSCGHNLDGLLGDGTSTNRCVLGPTLLNNCTSIAVSRSGVALKNDGTVWTWGSNAYNCRGYETSDDLSPGPIPGMTNVRFITCSFSNCFAIKDDGSAWAWGTNKYGCLGDGTDINRSSPVRIEGLPNNVVSISSSRQHTLALDNNGSVWAWGRNNFGQLGDGTTSDSDTPKKISIDHVKAIFARGSISIVLKDDGTVWAWGNNANGELGDGTKTTRASPVKVSSLSDVTALSTIGSNTIALKRDGSAWAWGLSLGILGTGSKTQDYLSNPQKIRIEDVSALSTNLGNEVNFYVVMKRDGSLWAWGRNYYGELGIGFFDFGEVDNRWGVWAPTKVLTEPGATPVPTATVMPTSSPTISPTPNATSPAQTSITPIPTQMTPTATPTATNIPSDGTITPSPTPMAPSGSPVPSQAGGFGFGTIIATISLAFVYIYAHSTLKKG